MGPIKQPWRVRFGRRTYRFATEGDADAFVAAKYRRRFNRLRRAGLM